MCFTNIPPQSHPVPWHPPSLSLYSHIWLQGIKKGPVTSESQRLTSCILHRYAQRGSGIISKAAAKLDTRMNRTCGADGVLSLPPHLCACRGQRSTSGAGHLLFEDRVSCAGQGLANEARLAGWQVWGPLPSHQCWGYVCTPPHLAFYLGAGAHALTQPVLYRWSHRPSLQLAVTKGPHSISQRPTGYTDTGLSSDERGLLLPTCLDPGE